MHPVITMKHWSHHLHDSMLSTWHHIDEHLHSHQFWAGVMLTLIILGIVTMLAILAWNAPIMHHQLEMPPYVPYGV